jgi:SAM-dependent methyltransferase
MPRPMKTLIPRIKKSVEQRGLIASILRSALLPVHLFQEYRVAKMMARDRERSDFDLTNGVETDGDIGGWTYLSDLNIPSPNWIYGRNYAAIEPQRFVWILSRLELSFKDFTFIDFGSGKGRALLMASEFPFRKIVGVEFSPELHAIAERNIKKYQPPRQQCKLIESLCMDFIEFKLPDEPCVMFFFDPCEEKVLAKTLENIKKSLQERPRPIYLIYVSSRGDLLNSVDFLVKLTTNEEYRFSLYKNAQFSSVSSARMVSPRDGA